MENHIQLHTYTYIGEGAAACTLVSTTSMVEASLFTVAATVGVAAGDGEEAAAAAEKEEKEEEEEAELKPRCC